MRDPERMFLYRLADRLSTPVFLMEQAPANEPNEWLAYFILSKDPLGKRYMDALTQRDPLSAAHIRKLILDESHGNRR